ncbi:MAG: homoserine O-acetyltransferase [Bacteroidota bacterium]
MHDVAPELAPFRIASFETESGQTLAPVDVAFRTWGTLNAAGDNALVVCHALTGNADVDDWWAPLLGPGMAFDTDQFFVVACNVLGSCYGTTGPASVDPSTGKPYGTRFPEVTVRDTVRLHRAALEALGVRRVAAVVGGSMGGMQALEWAFHSEYVRSIVPMACGAAHSAWCIGWSEAQRQAIYGDPKWQAGQYDPADPPAQGLSTARQMAMISYRTSASFQARFGRETRDQQFSVESYLGYQGRKLVERFDAASYVRLTQLMDSHDVGRGRGGVVDALAQLTQPALVIGIDSDILYPLAQQQFLAQHLPQAELRVIESAHGHDAFLIEFDQLSSWLRPWLQKQLTTAPQAA